VWDPVRLLLERRLVRGAVLVDQRADQDNATFLAE
jgi:hypothetical protein